jgi:hypothetical protein
MYPVCSPQGPYLQQGRRGGGRAGCEALPLELCPKSSVFSWNTEERGWNHLPGHSRAVTGLGLTNFSLYSCTGGNVSKEATYLMKL